MDTIKRKTKRYSFAKPDLARLRELGSLVTQQEDFQKQHGKLLNLLKVRIGEGSLETLVQFYDPLYHCFTFPDYQLVPTLEEYSYLMGLPILNQIPFHGLEPIPTPLDIANALHIEASLIKNNLTTKSGLLGLPINFLFQQAFTSAKERSNDAFYSILALLIYGLILFPNPDNFVDIHAIQIFLTRNPVPTLLADTYHFIHDRTLNGRGAILCCAPLLYNWFTFHLPQTRSFQARTENLPWSERIMSLAPSDVVWCSLIRDVKEIIVSCGEYPNVPLIGRRGGITYNPILAKRQFRYPVKTIPNTLALAREFYLNHEDPSNHRGKFARAWYAVRRLNKSQLGKKSDSVHSSYTQWVIDRAMSFGMPYHMTRALSSTTPSSPLPLPLDIEEEFQGCIAELTRERDAWKRKFQLAELEIESLKRIVEQRDHQISLQKEENLKDKDLLRRKDALLRQDSKRRKRYMDMFDGSQSDDASASGF